MLCLLYPGLTDENVLELGYTTRVVERLVRQLKQNPHNHVCLEFTGWRNQKGYGRMKVRDGLSMYAHRLSYELFYGEKLIGVEVVRHRCNNPACCNPLHLMKGSIIDNNADRLAAGNYHIKRGKRRPHTRVEDVLRIKLALRVGTMSRTEICNEFNIHYQSLKDLENGKTWARIKLPEKEVFEYDPFLDF